MSEPEKWTIESSMYEGFVADIMAWDRPPGKRLIAVVREYADALAIVAAHEARTAPIQETDHG